VLLVLPLFVLIYLWLSIRKQSRRLRIVTLSVERLGAREPVAPSHGLSSALYESLVQVFAKPSSFRAAWNGFNSLIVPRRESSGEEEYWACESSDVAFSEAAVIEGRINRGFFSAVPGIVTGAGLFFTFLAILVALLDVKMGPNSQIKGLHLLIEGLSGKFVSSIGALASATIYLIAEKPLLHRLTRARLRLVEAIDALVPRLSSVRVLAEIQRDIAEQSNAFKSFNADLSLKLKQSFSESMGPTIKQMVDAVEALNQLLRAAEAQKQESITGALGAALQHLEQSIKTSLEGMGEKFKESLSGSAKDEFGKVTETLSGAARVLENVKAQSEMTQTALNDLINLAKSSTAEQMALGKSQVEDLTAVLRQFMVQMNETAGTSVTQMAATLTSVVHDLSTKVADLGQQMATTMQENTDKATSAASVVVEQAGAWSARSAEQLTQLLETQKSHLTNIKDVDGALESALALFNDSLGRYTALNADLGKIGGDINANAVAVAGATRSMQETQKAVQQVAAYAASQLERLGEENLNQKEVWESIHGSMEQYRNVFAQTEKAAGELLAQITRNLSSHIDLTKQGYEHLVAAADDHFKAATQKLGASVNELDEYLQDLIDLLGKGKGNKDGHQS
jgi:signal transduction histidine kinase